MPVTLLPIYVHKVCVPTEDRGNEDNDIGSQIGNADSVSENFSLAPMFTDPPSLDFTPSPESPLIDRGKNPPILAPNPPFNEDWSLGGVDLIGDLRLQGVRVDVGALETFPLPDMIFVNSFE